MSNLKASVAICVCLMIVSSACGELVNKKANRVVDFNGNNYFSKTNFEIVNEGTDSVNVYKVPIKHMEKLVHIEMKSKK